MEDDGKELLIDFQEVARALFSDAVGKLLNKYEAAVREIQETRRAHSAAERKMLEVIEPLREENRALKEELEQMRSEAWSMDYEVDKLLQVADELSMQEAEDKGVQGSICAINSSMFSSHPPQPYISRDRTFKSELRRMVVFLDPSPECDDECALLYIFTECHNSHLNAVVDLIVPDSVMRFHWLSYLFEDKLALGGGWIVSEDGSSIIVNNVTVNLWLAPSSKESMVNEDFKKKLGDKFRNVQEYAQINLLRPRLVDDCPGGDASFILMAAPVPELSENFFERFRSIGTSYVVGTPGGVNCPQPSWSKILYPLHKRGPIVYLAPQFTREVRFPRDYVDQNPHWTWYMKETVFDSVLTVMARRPEIPAQFGDWGLVLRLNAANAKVSSSWYYDVIGRQIELDIDDRFQQMVEAYVERNSGFDRKFGAVLNELKLLGVELKIALDENGQPATEEGRLQLTEAYRKELFKAVYTCVLTTDTLLFSHQSKFKFTGSNGTAGVARCGYAEPLESLAKIFGISEAVDILRALPLRNLTPAYDMVGAICALDFIKSQELEEYQPLRVEVNYAPHELSTKLIETYASDIGKSEASRSIEADDSPHGIFIIDQQPPEVVEQLIDLLNVNRDPLLIIDEFWARMKQDMNKANTGRKTRKLPDQNSRLSFGGMDFATTLSTPMYITEDSSIGREGSMMGHSRFVWHPGSLQEALWSFISMILIIHDCLMTPLTFFGNEDNAIVLLSFTIWWTLDLVHNFRVGFYVHGVVELRPRLVALKYLKTCFALDLFVLTSDWIYIISSNDSLLELLRFAKMFRILRLIYLVQCSKADRVIQPVLDLLPGRTWIVGIIKVVQIAFGVLVFNNIIACIWYYIGIVHSRHSRPNWLELSELNSTSGAMLYFTCLHWSLAHLMLESIDVYPVNITERIFAMLVLCMGMVVFSTLVSTITEVLQRSAASSAENSRRDSEVRKYMEDHNVSAPLTMMIHRYRVDLRRKAAIESLPLDQVEGLTDLPDTLAIRLCCEVFGTTLQSHGFFKVLQMHFEVAATSLIHYCMSEAIYAPRKRVFSKGFLADTVMIVSKGRFSYLKEHVELNEAASLQWVSEPALWLNGWKRRGALESRSSLEVHVLDIAKFQEVAQKFWHVGMLGCHFAELVAYLKIPFGELHDLQIDMSIRERLADEALALLRPE